MAKYLFFNVPTTGHVDPTLQVATELIRRGHQVDYFLTEAYRQRVEATGAAYHAYDGIEPDYFEATSQRFNPARLATQLVETASLLLPSLMEAIALIQPAVIVYDSMCPWGRVAAKQMSLPAVASMALLDLPMRYLFKSGEWASALPVMVSGLPWIMRYVQAARRLQRTSGVPVPAFIQVLNWPGDHNLCYTAREFLPDHPHDGADYSFVGSLLPDGAANIPFPFERLSPNRPLIYISLGTVFNHNPDFFQACLNAFAGRDVQVVVSTGNGIPASDLTPLPDNAIVCDYVPQGAILELASLYISHSGANSVHHALLNGVPLLLVPQQLEQALIAARVKELGAGLILNRRSVNPDRIRQMAQQLLGDKTYSRQATRLGEALREAGGAARAADVLEGLLDRYAGSAVGQGQVSD